MDKPFFRLSFAIGPTNDERYGALALYEKAFGAKMLSVSTPPEATTRILCSLFTGCRS